MLSDRDIELAHAEAFDFVFGNLPPARRAEFTRHLASCRHCQGVIDEYSEIGGIIKLAPPHVEPSADLEDRTVAAMIAAVGTVRRGAEPLTRIQPRPQFAAPAATGPQDATQPRPALVNQPAPAEPADPPAEPTHARRVPADAPEVPADGPGVPADPPGVTRLRGWRRRPGRLVAAVAVAAAIIAAAVVVPLSLGRGGPAQPAVVVALRATAAGRAKGFGAATGQAIVRPDASGSWDITLTVQHLKQFGNAPWYECWYVSRDGRQVASAGTFVVSSSGSTTFSMTSAVDPRDFRTMEITLQSPSNDGALGSTVILTGQSVTES